MPDNTGRSRKHPPADDAPRRRLHGRRKGRPLRAGRARLLETLLPEIAIDLPPESGGDFDPAAWFPDAREIWLEIGFGGGEHLAAQAAAHPDAGIIGCEFFVNGVASLLRHVDEAGLGNVRVYQGDARRLIDALAPRCLTRLFLLHPDPWPKRRHAGRRFVQPETLDRFARLLVSGGELRISTDDPVYLEWTLMQMGRRQDFTWMAATADDWRRRPADWPPTRYEEKALKAGRRCTYLRYRRESPAG